jgi:hypothetical protein
MGYTEAEMKEKNQTAKMTKGFKSNPAKLTKLIELASSYSRNTRRASRMNVRILQ